MLATNVSGWMADFGESLPLNAALNSKADPAKLHSKYPEMWATLNKEAITTYKPVDGITYNVRTV